MHIKILLFIILANLSAIICTAQSPRQTIKGRVVDAESGQPISNVNVVIENLNTTTDEQGYFRLEKVLVGRHSLKFSRVGYENAFIKELLVGSGKEIVLDIKLTEQIKSLEEVVVTPQKEYGSPNNDMATISVRSFSVEQTKRYPATWSDPARMALSFAGTSNVNDSSNEIVIRGNSPKGLLWRMNGVEIPSPNHFTSVGAAGGGISALSINVLSNSDFYTGAFPAEYGNAASGVFDLTMRNGNNTKWENSIQLGFQGLEASTEGPFSSKSKASYLLNYRYSTLGLIQKMGLLDLYDDKPNYQDLAFKIYVPLQKTTLSLWGLGGLSINENANFPNYLPKNGSNFYATGLNIVSLINDKAYWENIISASGSETNNNNSSGVVRNYTYGFLRYSSMFNLKANAQNTIRFGLILTNNHYDLSDKRTFLVDKKPVTNTILQDKDNTQLVQSYFQWKYRINPKLTLNTGIHSMYLTLNNQSSVEPRFGLRFQVDNKRSINFGAGLHSRLEALPTYLSSRGFTVTNGDTTLIQSNKNLPIPKSVHAVIGYETRPNSNWRINAEAYYQRQSQAFVSAQSPLSNVLSFESTYSSLNELAANLTSALTGTGTGEAYGIELTIEKFLTNGFYLLNTTSLYKATYIDASGIERRGRFSSNFVENIMAGKEWKVGKAQKNIFNINLKIAWAGGLRVIPIDLPKSIKANTTIYDYSRIYEERFDNFFRTDFRISYVINKNKKSSTFSLDLNNITNQKNPLNHFYSQSLKGIAYSYQLGMIPIFNYRLEF
jgi:CarboxypepD_reg-like domain/TonB-dependent Receptor Plug Domain